MGNIIEYLEKVAGINRIDGTGTGKGRGYSRQETCDGERKGTGIGARVGGVEGQHRYSPEEKEKNNEAKELIEDAIIGTGAGTAIGGGVGALAGYLSGRTLRLGGGVSRAAARTGARAGAKWGAGTGSILGVLKNRANSNNN